MKSRVESEQIEILNRANKKAEEYDLPQEIYRALDLLEKLLLKPKQEVITKD